MGRPKGSKNKKTLAKLAKTKPYKKDTKYASKLAIRASDNENECVQLRLSILENTVRSLVASSNSELRTWLEKKLETLDAHLCKLFVNVDSIEKTLSPLMFIESTSKGSAHEKENENCEEAC